MVKTIRFSLGGVDYCFRFPEPRAVLPIRTRRDSVAVLPWGRRPRQHGELPLGGEADLEAVRAGSWDRWFPRPVQLRVVAFEIEDVNHHRHWNDLSGALCCIQGLVARNGTEQRAYIVMESRTPDDLQPFYRYPRLIGGRPMHRLAGRQGPDTGRIKR
jgi:hypothetical protein